jgi:adenylate cyclase
MPSPLDLPSIELRLRPLLPADLYAAVWIEPSAEHLQRVFEHLRTLQHILMDYVPRDVGQAPTHPGRSRYAWKEGCLMFTDLAGFTPLLEAMASAGIEGAETLLALLNHYFASMIDLIGKSGGNLLEFTGDALLVEFAQADLGKASAQAIAAGLRMQRAMAEFASLETPQGELSLQMRVGLHVGRFVIADIGTPMRMARGLLGQTVQVAKRAEGAGEVGLVSLTQTVCDLIQGCDQRHPFTLQLGNQGHSLVMDDLSETSLGEYSLVLPRRRSANSILFDRSAAGILAEIQSLLRRVEPLASYLPQSVLQLLVNTAAKRRIPPAFPTIAVAFVNLVGIPEAVDRALPEEVEQLVSCFSKAFALINGVVEYRGGILQKVTYHSIGSEMLIHFGVLNPDPSDPFRAAQSLLEIQALVARLEPPTVQSQKIALTCRIGLTYGPVFAAEVGEPRGRREFNILGDTVNTAARLMGKAAENQILINQRVQDAISSDYDSQQLGTLPLKGKASPEPIFALLARRQQAAGFTSLLNP